ncbi:SNF1-interacting protein, partial [Friedmanniomyces endolithicus]
MGNSSSKDERRPSRPQTVRNVSSNAGPATPQPPPPPQTQADRLASHIYSVRSGAARGSRPDLSFLTLGRDRDHSEDGSAPERARETKQEKEVRRAERDRQVRVKERERSMREEGVDGGYL